jgi:excisionase family DNA binding protein
VLSVREVSERFKVPKATIYEYIRDGRIRAIRHPLSRRILIPESEIPKLQAVSEFYAAKAAKEGEVVRP